MVKEEPTNIVCNYISPHTLQEVIFVLEITERLVTIKGEKCVNILVSYQKSSV